MDKSSQIAQCFQSNQLESWETGLALLLEPPQGVQFLEGVTKAILRQAKMSGVPASKLNNSSLVEELELLVVDLISFSPQSQMHERSETFNGAGSIEMDRGTSLDSGDPSGDDTQAKLPGFVRFMRGFEPSEHDCDVWNYIVDKRIKPALVQRCELKQTRKTSYIDPDKEPPERNIVVASDLSVHDRYKEMLVKDCLAQLVPLDQAIFLMTYWAFLTVQERDEHRPEIITTAVANCKKKKDKEDCGSAQEDLIENRRAAFDVAEAAFQSSEFSKRVEAAELQIRVSYHFVAADDAERCKVEKAKGFLFQSGHSRVQLGPKASSKTTKGAANSNLSLNPQDRLREICHLATKCSSQDKFNAQFYLIHPLDSIYHYKQKQGVLKIRDQGLWLLMWFGRFCQRQRYHLSAYQSLYKTIDSMKPVLGFSDEQIGKILCEKANNIRQRRYRYREFIKELCPPETERPSNTDESPMSLIETICGDY